MTKIRKGRSPGTCCGAPVRTAFCPQCGKDHRDDRLPLRTLLGHCESRVKQLEISREWYTSRLKNDLPDEQKHRVRTKAAAHARLIAKWSSWVQALTEVLAAGQKGKD